ncbi:unnamed protein product [Rotaria socialis]|uniref:SAM domain-containing protein n=2 Tax=Rotaria socialis TaxID=392032 RepID=A0A821M8R3_9BILA|nr:unnamed protein product [Rotaria socialis]CAF3217081.1 unnamed protein product [Rotaria socialis]CAF3741439.1 unnamed protein product [Rotaria socialis]CAF3787501.1 unnamed protein product [Rotaria socialis]CAF4125844.1 unnamed protein product [Rotaria socialis]
MPLSSEKFADQYSRIQQQFKELAQFEQLYTVVELTRTFQVSYRHFILQLFQATIQCENNDMFNHTVDDANAPDIVACLLSNSLDKILFTIQLYLPLISTKTINEQLLDAYRKVLIYLDSNILNLSKFSYKEEQIINLSQQILFFIQTNPYLKKLLSHLPQLIKLLQTHKFQSDEQQQYHQPLQRYSSKRSDVPLLMNYSSEGLPQNAVCQQLTRCETNDSGVDLTEPSIANSKSNLLLSPNSQHSFVDRSHRMNLSASASVNPHSFVAKTASSPIPEHVTVNFSDRTLLKCVLSAPPSTAHSDYRNRNGGYSQKHVPALSKSDEEEPELQKSNDEYKSEEAHRVDHSKSLTQFYSLRYPNTKNNQNRDNVSQYLAIDANSSCTQNTFIQPNTGMRDVPRWLRHLRLHKYDVFFSKMVYDQMMSLTIDDLKELHITDGACTKMLLHIKKLKERSALLKQWILDLDDGQTDLMPFIEKISELLITPIRSKQLELENNSAEDLPSLIMQVLEKIYQKLTPNSSSDIGNSLLGLFDRCYKHKAFTDDQRHVLLQWRGSLSSMLQSLGRIEYKTIQHALSHASEPRRTGKARLKNFRSSTGIFNSNHSSNSIPLSKFTSEPRNNNFNESNLIQRPNRSPAQIYPTHEEQNQAYLQTSFSCLTSTPQNNDGAYYVNNHRQALTRKASINPYDESNTNNRTKLCKTFSDPSRIRFYNPTHVNHMLLQASTCQPAQQQNLFRMISTPYSQQQIQFISRSPPTTGTMDVPPSPIKKCFTENGRSDYYENHNNSTPLSNTSNATDIENTDDQRQNNTEIESLCRQITESAMCDDIHDSSTDYKEEISNVKQSSNNSTDTEQSSIG